MPLSEKGRASRKRWADANPEKKREAHRRWVEANPERYRELQRAAAQRHRTRLANEMIDAYGGQCSCCGETERGFLTLEHIGGLKGKERRSPMSEMSRLRKLGWPDECTVLCFNCNLGSARNGGVCPHAELVMDENEDVG